MTPREPGTLRLASYNIHKAVGTDGKRRPDRILAVIARLQADIVVLQEADRRLGARPSTLPAEAIAEVTGLVPIGAGRNGVSLGWHGNAILVRPEMTVRDIQRLPLPGLEPRGAIIADLQAAEGGLRVVGVHLGLMRSSRRAQLTALLQALSARPPLPTLVAGDFNEWSMQVGLGRIAPHFTLLAPGQSFHARFPMASLDRFAFDDRVVLQGAGVAEDPLARVASDHLPIWLDFTAR